LADTDQERKRGIPQGERFHVHLYPSDTPRGDALSRFSVNTEVCRLDAKGTGEFPVWYRGESAED
jgi:hypothetical protein